MQDKDNIAQMNKENNENNELMLEVPDSPTIRQTTSETPILEKAADETFHAQNADEIPNVEFPGNQEEIPTVNLNSREIPTAENAEFQSVQNVEIADVPKVEAKYEEQFMFNGYELKTWEFNPRIYKILTGSTIFCVLALVAVAQSNVLNTRACDAPMVNKICQVLDTVYVGTVLLGKDNEWVSEPYEKTDLSDAEITYIDTSNISPPLPYPEGYFALANPEMNYNDPLIIPGSEFPTTDGFPPPTNNFPPPTMPPSSFPPPTSPKNNPITAPPKLPKRNPNGIKGIPPDAGLVIGDDNPIGEGKNPKGGSQGFPTGEKKEDTTKDKETAKNNDKQPEIKSDSLDGSRINKEPLKDFAKAILALREKQNGKLDLTKNFYVELNGTLTEEGKFDKNKSKYGKVEGEEEIINIAKDAIEAIGDSKLFGYLKDLDVDKVNFVIEQNDKEIYVMVRSGQPNEERAKRISSGFNTLISIAKNNLSEKDKELVKILDVSKWRAEGKTFVLDFKLDKDTAQSMIKDKLKEEAEKAAEELQKAQQPNSTTNNSNMNQNTAK